MQRNTSSWNLIWSSCQFFFFRPSPKLVLIILQLCRVALPLMNTADCEQVELPVWGQHLTSTHWNTSEPITDPPAKIVSLLLAKLGDFLVPGKKLCAYPSMNFQILRNKIIFHCFFFQSFVMCMNNYVHVHSFAAGILKHFAFYEGRR